MLLNISALTKTYTISGKLITALNTVDLTFSENSFTCIVGKSGCGKTTLLRLLSGLEPATSGTIDYGKAAKIGFVFQEPRLMPWLTVNANIAFAAKNDRSFYKKIKLLVTETITAMIMTGIVRRIRAIGVNPVIPETAMMTPAIGLIVRAIPADS